MLAAGRPSPAQWAEAVQAHTAFCTAYSGWALPARRDAHVSSSLLEEAARWAACRRTPASAQTNAHLRAAFFARILARLRVPGPFAELGVRRGDFSGYLLLFLRKLRNATAALPRFFLVDTWRHVPASQHYVDGSNVGHAAQRANLKTTVDQVARFWAQVSLVQLKTTEAALLFPNRSLGFVYLDARHDYCAVKEDLALYWPKLAPGGILAGDDYNKLEWPWCENGTRVDGGLDLAVNEFARAEGLRLMAVREQWLIQKPHEEQAASADDPP